MRKIAFLSMLILTSLGLAQDMPPAKEMVISKKVFLVFQSEVKKELKITDAQEGKVKEAFGDSLQVDGDKIMIMMTGDTDLDTMAKNALKVLDADQTKRLNEVWIQSLDGAAIADDEVSKQLEITADQKKNVDKLIDEAGTAIMDEIHAGAGHTEDAAKKFKEIRKKAGEKIVALLTEDQKKKYETLKGKEFKFKAG